MNRLSPPTGIRRLSRLPFLLLPALMLVVSSLGAQDTGLRVVVHPFEVVGGSNELAVVSTTMRDTIELSLRLIGRFRVTKPEEETSDDVADRTIDGRSYEAADGSIRFELTVSEGASGNVLFHEEYTAETLFDVFDVADTATVALLESLVERQLSFGRLRVVVDEPAAPFTVFLDETEVANGVGTAALDRVVAGRYQLEIVLDRPLGRASAGERTITVQANQVTTVEIPVPLITETERAALQKVRSARDYRVFRENATDSAFFPAQPAVVSWLENVEVPRAAHLLPTREIRIDGDPSDWTGIPATRSTATPRSDRIPQRWYFAISPDGSSLFVLAATAGGTPPRDLWYRFWITPDGSRNTPDRFQVDIRPIQASSPSQGQWWRDEDNDVFVEFTLPTHSAIADTFLEARIALGERAIARPVEIGGEVLMGQTPYTRFVDFDHVRLEPQSHPERTLRSAQDARSFLAELDEQETDGSAAADANDLLRELSEPIRILWRQDGPTGSSHYLALRGEIMGNSVGMAGWTDSVVFDPDENHLRITDPDLRNGIEFRNFNNLDQAGEFRAVGTESRSRGRLEMAVWSREILGPSLGSNNTPVDGDRVDILEHREDRIIGTYRLQRSDSPGSFSVTGYFRVNPDKLRSES